MKSMLTKSSDEIWSDLLSPRFTDSNKGHFLIVQKPKYFGDLVNREIYPNE